MLCCDVWEGFLLQLGMGVLVLFENDLVFEGCVEELLAEETTKEGKTCEAHFTLINGGVFLALTLTKAVREG